MAYYNSCPYCGSNLDPGEMCDCQQEARKSGERKRKGGDNFDGYIKAAGGILSRQQNKAVGMG